MPSDRKIKELDYDFAFAAACKQINKATDTLNTIETEAIAWEGAYLAPRILAHFIRQQIPLHKGSHQSEHMTKEQKDFWLAFAEELGPDWIIGFTHASKFIATLNKF